MRRLTFLACTQVDKITYLAMGLRMLAVHNEMLAHPRVVWIQKRIVRFARGQRTTRITGTFRETKVFSHMAMDAAN